MFDAIQQQFWMHYLNPELFFLYYIVFVTNIFCFADISIVVKIIAKLSQAQAQLGLSWLYFHITQPPPPTRESLFWTQLAFNLAHSNSENQPAHAIASHKLVLVDSLASCS